MNWKKTTYVIGTLLVALTLGTRAEAEEPEKIELIAETFDDNGYYGEIYRYYQEVGKKERIPYAIPVPDSIYERVKDTDNPLLEAKKELTVAYQYLKLEKRLSELNGIYLDRFPKATISVGDDLRPSFEADLDIINEHVNNELALIEKMEEKEREERFKVTDIKFVDYGKEEAFYEKTEPNFDEMKEAQRLAEKDAEAMRALESQPINEEVEEKTSIGLYISIALVIGLFGSLTIFVIRKRG